MQGMDDCCEDDGERRQEKGRRGGGEMAVSAAVASVRAADVLNWGCLCWCWDEGEGGEVVLIVGGEFS